MAQSDPAVARRLITDLRLTSPGNYFASIPGNYLAEEDYPEEIGGQWSLKYSYHAGMDLILGHNNSWVFDLKGCTDTDVRVKPDQNRETYLYGKSLSPLPVICKTFLKTYGDVTSRTAVAADIGTKNDIKRLLPSYFNRKGEKNPTLARDKLHCKIVEKNRSVMICREMLFFNQEVGESNGGYDYPSHHYIYLFFFRSIA